MQHGNVYQYPRNRPMLSPYTHELNGSGTACSADCPACQWARSILPEADRIIVAQDEALPIQCMDDDAA